MIPRVIVTEKAAEIIDKLRSKHGEIIFHQSGGCCDGSAPSCFEATEFNLGHGDVFLGRAHKCNFYMSSSQFEYMRYSQVILDIMKGMGSAFSLEIPLGYRFVVRSRIINEQEEALLSQPIELKSSGFQPDS